MLQPNLTYMEFHQQSLSDYDAVTEYYHKTRLRMSSLQSNNNRNNKNNDMLSDSITLFKDS